MNVVYRGLRFAASKKDSEGADWFQPLKVIPGADYATPEEGLKFAPWIGFASHVEVADPSKGVEIPSSLRYRSATEVVAGLCTILNENGVTILDGRITYRFGVEDLELSIDELRAGKTYCIELYCREFLWDRVKTEAYAYRVNASRKCKSVKVVKAYGDPGAWQVVAQLLPRYAKDNVRFMIYKELSSLLTE